MKDGYIKNGWFYHKCGRKLFRVTDEMCKIKAPEYCQRCKEEFEITIVNGMIVENNSLNIVQSR